MTQARMRLALVAVCVAALGTAAGCAGKGGPSTKVTSEFTSADASLFDDGVDFIHSAVALEGRWQQDWTDDTLQRVERSDVIASVVVRTVITDVSPQGENTYQLTVEVGDTLKGELPADEVFLRSTPASRGYRTVDARTANLESGRFLLFAKWAPDDREGVAMRWHLAPDSKDVRAVVNRLLKPRESSEQVVNVRPLEE